MTTVGGPLPERELRLALVLNGGVSLAVWIGGVTREIDAARRGRSVRPGDTADIYALINAALHQSVVVDVIGGASAGGINGVCLATAIFNASSLDELRETWIELGDFRALLRSPAESDPPSLMKGDDVVLTRLRALIRALWSARPSDQETLYLYVTATDLFGFPVDFEDSDGRTFEELDHRRVFRFKYSDADIPDTDEGSLNGVMRATVNFQDDDAPELLARAARGSSSFPVAFEAHSLDIVDRDQVARRHWLVDGGILDNQPFNPVLDRIRVLSAKLPVKRVVMYVVPYATEVGSTGADTPETATALETYGAAGSLPRDLPKLESLTRITREYQQQKLAAAERDRVISTLDPEQVGKAAAELFPSYQRVRLTESQAVFEYWASPRFAPGNGVLAQDPADDPDLLLRAPSIPTDRQPSDQKWIPSQLAWDPLAEDWQWGLSPAERIAAWSLLFLRDEASSGAGATTAQLLPGRLAASRLIEEIRRHKVELRQAFFAELEAQDVDSTDPLDIANLAYARITSQLKLVQARFREINSYLQGANLGVQDMLNLEVIRNALSVPDETIAFPFDFLFASAAVRNSLGHQAFSPDQKLAGMKLNHFGGFLKRSWRANDWLWGRLDGTEHAMRALVDPERIGEVKRANGDAAIAQPLTTVALALDLPDDAEERTILADLWTQTIRLRDLTPPPEAAKDAEASFTWAVLSAAGPVPPADAGLQMRCLDAVRSALAARIQLRVITDDLGRVEETALDDLADGASRIANGAAWARRYPNAKTLSDKAALFRDLRIGEETLQDEASSRLVFDLGSQSVAVATAMVAGNRGGLPAAARGALATARGITLASSRLISLIAREPWLGAAAFAILVGLTIWAAISPSTLLGTLLPALAILSALGGIALFTIATSTYEDTPRTVAGVLGALTMIAIPAVYAVLAWKPGFSDTLHHWFIHHTGAIATGIAGVSAYAAAGLAVLLTGSDLGAAVLSRDYPRRWRRTALALYRAAIVVAFTALAVGFIVEKWDQQTSGSSATTNGWNDVANAHRGTILIITLLATLLAAGFIESALARRRVRRSP